MCLAAGEAAADSLVPPVHSLSCGAPNRGRLAHGIKMPASGEGFVVPARWRKRNHLYGTQELVSLIERAARKVVRKYPGSLLGVSDLSQKGGGTLYNHASHQSGRDADLHYYAMDRQHRPFRPDDNMPYYMYSGRSVWARATGRIPERFFDLKRNWAFVKVLLADRTATVTHIFMSWRIREWLLKYAKAQGEPSSLIKRAAKIIKPQREHNDHMHVRIACPSHGLHLGRCRQENWPVPRRARKKKHVRLHYWLPCPRNNNS